MAARSTANMRSNWKPCCSLQVQLTSNYAHLVRVPLLQTCLWRRLNRNRAEAAGNPEAPARVASHLAGAFRFRPNTTMSYVVLGSPGRNQLRHSTPTWPSQLPSHSRSSIHSSLAGRLQEGNGFPSSTPTFLVCGADSNLPLRLPECGDTTLKSVNRDEYTLI